MNKKEDIVKIELKFCRPRALDKLERKIEIALLEHGVAEYSLNRSIIKPLLILNG